MSAFKNPNSLRSDTPAFPCTTGTDGGIFQQGMTPRQWYAGMALQVIAAKADKVRCPKNRLNDSDKWRQELAAHAAKKCFWFADAMIEEGGR